MGKISEVWMDDEIRLDMTNMNRGGGRESRS